jgi:hypothetical protein
MGFAEQDVQECRRLVIDCRMNQLAIGDILAGDWAEGADALGEFCERVGLSVSSASRWRAIARAVTPALREHLAGCGVFVSCSVLREGTRTIGGRPADDGFAKLLRLIAGAQAAGVDRVTHATYQTVLGTAPSLSEVMDLVKRQSEQVIDYVSEVNHSPHREELMRVLVADDATSRAELAAELDKRRAKQEERRVTCRTVGATAWTGRTRAWRS